MGAFFLEMYELAGSTILEVVYQLTTVTDVLEIVIILSLIVASIVVPSVGRRHRRMQKRDKNKKKQRFFQNHGGLEVFSMIYSGKPGGDYHVVPQGVQIPWLILDDYQGAVARSLKSPLSEVERPRVIIKLYCTPMNGRVNGLSIYGLT